MKKIIKIKVKKNNYKIIIQNNSILKSIKNEQKRYEKIFIIIDNKLKVLINNLEKNKNLKVIKIEGGEKIKSIHYYNKICLALLKLKVDRSSSIIAIGGGTIGDLIGFVSGTILRGINFILIPTTLLSQVDASIGGKNGINTIYGKNLIGTFLQPNKVIIDISFLKTLSKKQIRSGYAEILKHALIKDPIFYVWLQKNHKKVINLENKFVIEAIMKSIKIKAYFVENDERENLINKQSRAMLNFGHTFGHALEAMNNFKKNLTHGEAISIGMSLATKISYKINLISKKDYENLINHLKEVNLPFYDKRVEKNELYKLMLSDKKNSDNKINLILLKKIGLSIFKKGFDKGEIKKILS